MPQLVSPVARTLLQLLVQACARHAQTSRLPFLAVQPSPTASVWPATPGLTEELAVLVRQESTSRLLEQRIASAVGPFRPRLLQAPL